MNNIPRQAFDECDEDIAKLYLKTASVQLKKLSASTHSKLMKDVQQRAHRLSGASAFLGLSGMAKLLRDLEKAAELGGAKKANRFIGLLKEEFGLVQRQFSMRFP